MTEKSAAELERDADIARAKVADTAESIRSKITPGQLIDDFTGMFAGGDGSRQGIEVNVIFVEGSGARSLGPNLRLCALS